jgi:hypothetical protein
MNKEPLETKLKENHAAQLALPARVSLWSGKAFTYRVKRTFNNETELRIERVYRDGEEFDDFGTLIITPDGKAKYFTFHSFSGESAVDLNEARTYVRDCAELLSPEFLTKVADDYNSKIDDFNFLEKQEKEIRKQISEIEKQGGGK